MRNVTFKIFVKNGYTHNEIPLRGIWATMV